MIYSHSSNYESYNDSFLCLSRENIKFKIKMLELRGELKTKRKGMGVCSTQFQSTTLNKRRFESLDTHWLDLDNVDQQQKIRRRGEGMGDQHANSSNYINSLLTPSSKEPSRHMGLLDTLDSNPLPFVDGYTFQL